MGSIRRITLLGCALLLALLPSNGRAGAVAPDRAKDAESSLFAQSAVETLNRDFPSRDISLLLLDAHTGRVLTSRWGIFRALWVLGLFQAVANLGYAAAAWSDAGRAGIYAASLGESFGAGLGTAAFLAFLMNVCDKQQAATQYALLTSLATIGVNLLSASGGYLADQLGWIPFFLIATLACLPGLGLLVWIMRFAGGRERVLRPGD